jgi:hypothetical protein
MAAQRKCQIIPAGLYFTCSLQAEPDFGPEPEREEKVPRERNRWFRSLGAALQNAPPPKAQEMTTK